MSRAHTEMYRTVVKELIDRSYPLLRNRTVHVREYGVLFFPWYFITTGYALNLAVYRVIGLNKKARHYSVAVVRGLLAHELCHIETVERYLRGNALVNVVGLIYYGCKYLVSAMMHPSYSKKIEAGADIEAIGKGYGRELYEVAQMREAEFPRWRLSRLYQRGYLTPAEIKIRMEDRGGSQRG